MTQDEINFLKELAKNNQKYADQINVIVEAVKSDIRFKKDESLNYKYDFELPFVINLDSILELYNNHHSDEDFASLVDDVLGVIATETMKYADKRTDGEYDKVLATLMGDSIRASGILGMLKEHGDVPLGELFRTKCIPGYEVTRVLLGSMR
jgi:hypothetical protein